MVYDAKCPKLFFVRVAGVRQLRARSPEIIVTLREAEGSSLHDAAFAFLAADSSGPKHFEAALTRADLVRLET